MPSGYLYRDLDLETATWGYLCVIFAMQHSVMLDLTAELSDKVITEINRLWLRALRTGTM